MSNGKAAQATRIGRALIENDKQLSITMKARGGFVITLAGLLRQKKRGAFWDIQRDAIESMIAEFDEDIADYIARQSAK